jgi:site-specific recombinase XerD
MPLKLKGTVKPGEPDRRYYMIRVQVAGRREVLSTGTRKHDLALRKEALVVEAITNDPSVSKAALVALIRGEDSLAAKAAMRANEAMTLRDAFDLCLRSLSIWGGLKSREDYAVKCRTLQAILGADTPLAAIRSNDILELTQRLSEDGMAGGTINRHLACLRRMFNVALEQKDWKGVPSAFPKVKEVPERGGRQYFMPPADEKAIFEAVLSLDEERPGPQGGPPRKLDAHRYHRLFVVLVESGLRLGEALGLLHDELEMPRGSDVGMIELFRPEVLKTGKPRSVPMTAVCRQVFEECKGVPGGPFADLDKRRAQDIWTRAKKLAGIKHRDCVIHSLRHTCASRLLRAGVDIKVVKEWLGHSDLKTTDIYTHLETRQLTAAASALSLLRKQDEGGSSASI